MDNFNFKSGNKIIPEPEVLEKLDTAVKNFLTQHGYINLYDVTIVRQNRCFYFKTIYQTSSGKQHPNISKCSVSISSCPFKLYQKKLNELGSQDKEDFMIVNLSDEEYEERFSIKSLWGKGLEDAIRRSVRSAAQSTDWSEPTEASNGSATITYTISTGSTSVNNIRIDPTTWQQYLVRDNEPARFATLDPNIEIELHVEDEEEQNPNQ